MEVEIITSLAIFISAISLGISSFFLGKSFGTYYDNADKKIDKTDKKEEEDAMRDPMHPVKIYRDGVDPRVGVERANKPEANEENADD